MKLVWVREARQDRLAIWDYVSERDPQAAAALDTAFSAAAERLIAFPRLGHPGAVAGTRELTPHRNYRLVYEVEPDAVVVLALVHAARQWPPEA